MTIKKMELLTSSRLATLRKCARQHYYRYELGLSRIRTSDALRLGAAFHQGLESHNRGTEESVALMQATAGYEVIPDWADPIEWVTERETLRQLLAGHFWRYGQENLEFCCVEKDFYLPLVNPGSGHASRVFAVAGKIDAIVKLPDGRLAVLEYKTAGEDIGPDSDYWLRLRCDPQISLYVLAARALGHDVSTILYDVTRKPTIRRRQSETPEQYGVRLLADIGERPDYYFARREVPRLEDDLAEFRLELWQQAGQLREAQRAGALVPQRQPHDLFELPLFGFVPEFYLCACRCTAVGICGPVGRASGIGLWGRLLTPASPKGEIAMTTTVSNSPPPASPPAAPPANPRLRLTAAEALARRRLTFGPIPESTGHRIVLYGPGGIGKTTLACTAPGPVAFFDLDDSLAVLRANLPETIQQQLHRVGGISGWQTIRETLHLPGWDEIKTIVIDSATRAEELAVEHTLATVPHEKGQRVQRIEDYGFGKGYSHVYETFLTLLGDLDHHTRAGRNVLLICHDCTASVPNPNGEDWIRYEPRLQSPASGKSSIRLRVRESAPAFSIRTCWPGSARTAPACSAMP